MIEITRFTKCNTIVKGSKANMGLNPIGELNYGNSLISRALLYFDLTKLAAKITDKTYPDTTKLTHKLKMYNCGSVDVERMRKTLTTTVSSNKSRASSFDVIYFLLPKKWDRGSGFDCTDGFWDVGKNGYSEEGCTWYNATTDTPWDNDGIFTVSGLSAELTKYENGEESVVVGTQHFDLGNENFECDVTSAVNKMLTGDTSNFGIGVAFSPVLEALDVDYQRYVGFFTDRTNTLFEPCLETTYDDYIKDNRADFHIGQTNRLYLYFTVGTEAQNLDNIPTCTISGTTYEVKQATKGVYYVEFALSLGSVADNTILYDTWSNLAYNGTALADMEMQFTALPAKFAFGLPNGENIPHVPVPSLYGIGNDEKLPQGEKRRIMADFRIPYTTNQKMHVANAEYRIYCKSEQSEIEIIPWQELNQGYIDYWFDLDTTPLVPTKYYIDVRTIQNGTTKHNRNVLSFWISNNRTDERI